MNAFVMWLWCWLLRRLGLDQTNAYVEQMAASWPRGEV